MLFPVGRNVLSHLVDAARTDLQRVVSRYLQHRIIRPQHTIAINSYNIASSGWCVVNDDELTPSQRGRKILPFPFRPLPYQPVTSVLISSAGERAALAFRPACSITLRSSTSFLCFSLPLSPTQLPPDFPKMSVARAVRPFASRLLAQPQTPLCRAAPALRFPRGSTRSFSQSPLGEYMPSQAGQCSRMKKPKL